MSDLAFEFIEVSKDYGGTLALDRVSVGIPPGPHTAILGPSGCGKSTLLRLLAGLEAPTAGTILQDGQPISTAGRMTRPPHRRGLAMLFQDLALWPNLTAEGNIRMGLSGLGLSRHERARRIRESLELCGIAELANRLPSQLSGGQQQRTALARAAAVHPRFLLLDEPFSGIDLAEKSRLLTEIGKLAQERQFQVILVSHDPWDAVALCDTVILLERGVVGATGTFRELLSSASSEPFLSFRSLQDRYWSLNDRSRPMQCGSQPTANSPIAAE